MVYEVQRTVSGDPNDSVTYPGLACAGSIVNVETPTIRRITVKLSITAQNGFDEDDLAPTVQESVESYINGLGIGENIIRAEIIERAMAITGMYNVVVSLPTSDLTILETELPVPYDSDGDSLVTVS